MGEPIDDMAAYWATLGQRTQQYLDVWTTAAKRNAAGDYAAADLLADLETVWGMSIADATLAGSAVLAQATSFIPDVETADGDKPDMSGGDG